MFIICCPTPTDITEFKFVTLLNSTEKHPVKLIIKVTKAKIKLSSNHTSFVFTFFSKIINFKTKTAVVVTEANFIRHLFSLINSRPAFQI